MIDLQEDIHPLTDFKRNTVGFLKQMKRNKRAVVLTVNGKAELVVQDARSYQQILDRLDRLEAIEAIRIGVAAAEQGRVQPARETLDKLRGRLGIPG